MSLESPLTGKLQNVENRYEELNTQLADPDVVSDTKRYQKAAKSHSELSEIVARYRDYKEIEKGIKNTEAMLREAGIDAEMQAMAEEELAGLHQKLEQCE